MDFYDLCEEYVELYEKAAFNKKGDASEFIKKFDSTIGLIKNNLTLFQKNIPDSNDFDFFIVTIIDLISIRNVLIKQERTIDDIKIIYDFTMKHDNNLRRLKDLISFKDFLNNALTKMFKAEEEKYKNKLKPLDIVMKEREYFCELYMKSLFQKNGLYYYAINGLINYLISIDARYYDLEEDDSSAKDTFLSKIIITKSNMGMFLEFNKYLESKYDKFVVDNISVFEYRVLIEYAANVYINNFIKSGVKRKLPTSIWDNLY